MFYLCIHRLIFTNQNLDLFLKTIQTKWKEAGQIAPQQSEGLYESYKALLDRFYNQKNMENELLDLDRKRNLVAKLELCDKAEKLADVLSVNESVTQLNRFHEEYKAIGPIPKIFAELSSMKCSGTEISTGPVAST